MAKSLIGAPVPVPRLIPSVVNADPAVLARESTAHAEAILRQGDQTSAVQTQASAAVAALAATVTALAGRLLARQVFVASGVYTPTAGAKRATVRVCGGGGGGGGALSTVNSSVGGGGASGVTLEFSLGQAISDIGPLAAGAVAIGTAGSAGTAAPTSGGAGGASSLTIGATTYTASGGGGGSAGTMSGVGTAFGGVPGTGGTPGAPQTANSGTSGLLIDTSGNGIRGIGGSSPFGYSSQVVAVGAAPLQAVGFGAGGSGGVVTGVSSSTGGAGAPGIVIIEEFS